MNNGKGISFKPRVMAIYFIVLSMVTLVLAGCNFFEWANPSFTGFNTQSFTEKGQQLYNDGDYDGALSAYSNALVIDPGNSKARVGFARAAFWHFLPDFMMALSAEMLNNSNFQAEDLFTVIASPAGQKAIQLFPNQKFYQSIIGILNSPYGIVNGLGDGVITGDSLEANLMLLISYMFDLTFSMLDYNNDGVFGGPGDIMALSNDGTTTTPVFIMDFEAMMSNITATMEVNESNSGSNIIGTLENAHDSIENMLILMKFLNDKLYVIDDIKGCLLRPKRYLELFDTNLVKLLGLGSLGGGFATFYDSMLDASTNSNSVSGLADLFAYYTMANGMVAQFQTPLNDFHEVIVGTQAFYLHVSNFIPSPWASHTGGLKSLTETWSDLTNIGTNNLNSLISNLTNSFSMSELSNLLQLFSGMFGS
ncbi:MAG: tetratricopeptide repeat protein [Brevinematales bacterium]|nr:tetratricopeptide repeat protein [Brevinematales bacterium]